MTIMITKTKLALTILAIALLAPAAALATNVFADVPDGAFYADPVEWAFNNSITTGKSATSFAPLDDVTRGESVTFLKRYDDNIVQPALTTLTGDVATNTADIATNTADVATNTAAIAATRTAGTQDTTFNNPVTVDSSDLTIATVVATNPAGADVALAAHVFLEKVSNLEGRYFVQIVLGDCATGTVLGEAWWRPAISLTSTFQADTIAVTGFSSNTPANATFSLCANRFLGPNASATQNGMIATW